jgi:hypothetical protein
VEQGRPSKNSPEALAAFVAFMVWTAWTAFPLLTLSGAQLVNCAAMVVRDKK